MLTCVVYLRIVKKDIPFIIDVRTMATEIDLDRAQTILDYQFRNPDYLIEALQAAGSGLQVTGGRPLAEVNKMLAQFGDAVIKVVLLQIWVLTQLSRGMLHAMRSRSENSRWKGFANELVSRVGSKDSLAAVARTSGLDMCIALNPSQRGRVAAPAVLPATATAVLAAIWLDSLHSVEVTRSVMAVLRLALGASAVSC